MKKLLVLFSLFFGINANAQGFDMKEQLVGYMPYPDSVHFQVFSGGCTKKEDFRIENRNLGEVKSVTLYRIRRDDCLAFLPYGQVISFKYSELGLTSGDRFISGNSIATSVVW